MTQSRFKFAWLLPLVLTFTSCEKKVKLQTDEEKVGYALGQQIGSNLKTQNINFDSKALAEALEDQKNGRPSRLTQEEINQVFLKLQEKALKEQQAEAEKNLMESKKFLEESAKQEGVTVLPSGVQLKVLEAGSGPKPTADDSIKVRYRGTLANGSEFDSSYSRGDQPVEFNLRAVIPGWTDALTQVPVGSKVRIVIPPDRAYGSSPRPLIPANSALVFDVELVEIVKREQPPLSPPSAPSPSKKGNN